MKQKSEKIQVTSGAQHWPLVDRNLMPLYVGDKIRIQYCSGRYGQTAITEMVLSKPHYQGGCVGQANFKLSTNGKVLVGYHRHHDFEHGHETWVEKI